MLLSLFGCKKNTVTEEQTPVQENDPVEEIEETTDLSFLSSLEEKFAVGTISADDYVSCTLLSAFNGNEIPEAYRNENFEVTDIRPYIQNTMNCFDDLSEEVQLSVVEALTLCNIEFADVEEKNNDVMDMISDALFKDVNALADKAVIDQALLSKSGKFVIWYSDTDPNSAGHDKAQIVADTLDEAVEAYDSFFEVNYRFVSEYTYDETITYAKQGKILQRSGIDPSCLETCMNVYLSDFSSGSMKAYCLCGFDELGMIEKLVVPSAEAVWGSDSLYGIRTFPFIAIDSDSAFDTEMKMVIYHELFHYYQKRIIGDEPYCCDSIGGEGTANWASALKTPNTDNKVGYGEWADLWGMHCSEWLSHAKENAGYGLYPMLYNYQLNVEDGKQKIVDALF